MARKPTVGVVIPVYNRHRMLLQTLEFVLRQTRLPQVLVVADDGSTDCTADAAQAFLEQRNPPFQWHVVRLDHSTAARARNAGFAKAQTVDYIVFLDSDDHWPPDFLDRAVPALEAHPDAVAAVADRRFVSVTLDTQQTDCRGLATDPIWWLFEHGAGVASCTLCRREAIEAAGKWDATSEAGEDAVLFCKISLMGRWVHLPGDPVTFHIHTGKSNQTEEANLSRRHRDSLRRWAVIYETIYQMAIKEQPEQKTPLRIVLAKRWSLAGTQQTQNGNRSDAVRCFVRSLQWRPTELRNWRRLTRLALGITRADRKDR